MLVMFKWHQGKKCKLCVTLRTFKMSLSCSCFWGAAIKECSQKKEQLC